MTVLLLLFTLVVVPAFIGFFFAAGHSPHRPPPAVGKFAVGAPIVYRMQKASPHPSRNAHNVRPAERGEYYYYVVAKYWRVANVLSDGRIVAITRTNKRHYLRPDDSNLRKASLTERLLRRFPQLA